MKDKYDFNVCIKCQKTNKDVPCQEDCIYLEELNSQKEQKPKGEGK